MRYRRNARPNENQIATVRIVRKRNPKRRGVRRARMSSRSVGDAASRLAYWRHHYSNPFTPGQAGGLYTVFASQGMATNPRRKHRRVVRHRRPVKHRARGKLPKPPKGKRVGSVFKRKGRWFRVSSVKVRVGRRKIRRRVVRRTTARAAKRARK